MVSYFEQSEFVTTGLHFEVFLFLTQSKRPNNSELRQFDQHIEHYTVCSKAVSLAFKNRLFRIIGQQSLVLRIEVTEAGEDFIEQHRAYVRSRIQF